MKKLFILVCLFAATMSYQNCGKNKFALKKGLTSLDMNGNGLPDEDENGGTGDVLEDAKTNCSNAQSKGTLLTLNQTIQFDDTKEESGRSQVCLFNSDGNMGKTASKMAARYEQKRHLSIPANAVICDVEMSTTLQKFRYDDVFILTFNDRILAMNNRSTMLNRLSPEETLDLSGGKHVDLYKYDWAGLRGGGFENVVDDYCLGESKGVASCSWPVTEAQGQIYFDFDQELLINLGLKAQSDGQNFGFITTGDDDPNLDCYHEAISFAAHVKYYLQ